jgi:hypothetical protein
MAKQGSPFDSPAALAEWLPLLGAICQVLASISEAPGDEGEDQNAAHDRALPKAAAAGGKAA